MDENAFRNIRGMVSKRPCVFEKALLARHCRCSAAERHAIAERDAVSCASGSGHAACARLHALLHENALFALRLPGRDERIPHAKEMKLQCGGLTGLQRALTREGEIADVRDLVEAARHLYGSLDTLPFSEIMRAVSAYQPRRRPR
jgi:hypothetical protein